MTPSSFNNEQPVKILSKKTNVCPCEIEVMHTKQMTQHARLIYLILKFGIFFSLNLQIKVRPSVREVVAIYTIDEGSMELVVQLPNNFPLGPVTVDSGKKVGVTTSQWRTWMLQLTTFLQVSNCILLYYLVVFHLLEKLRKFLGFFSTLSRFKK